MASEWSKRIAGGQRLFCLGCEPVGQEHRPDVGAVQSAADGGGRHQHAHLLPKVPPAWFRLAALSSAATRHRAALELLLSLAGRLQALPPRVVDSGLEGELRPHPHR